MPSIEVLLPIGAAGFYLLDSILWLYGNEIVFYRDHKGWGYRAGTNWLLLRKSVYLPNPLTPHVPLWSVCWSEAPALRDLTELTNIGEGLQALWPIQASVLALLVLVVVGLPLVLLTAGQGASLLWLFGVTYALDLFALVLMWTRRRALHLSSRACVALTVDALACPPFAINLVRKITLRQALKGDPVDLARPVFDQKSMCSLFETLSRVVSKEIAAEEEGTPRHQHLVAYQQRLQDRGQCLPSS